MNPTLPENEAERQAALDALAVLDTGPDPALDALVQAAAALCGTPISLVSLVDRQRQWFKANTGLPGVQETPRDVAFCAHAILDDQPLVVPAAQDDPRFCDNPLVTGEPHIRFYAGVPLQAPQGQRIGTLCVIDRQPRELTPPQMAGLQGLALAASELLRQRLQQHQEHEAQRVLQHSADAVVTLDAQHRVKEWNPAATELFGWDRDEMLGQTLDRLMPEGTWACVADGPDHEPDAQPYDAVRRTRSGELRLVRITAVTIRGTGGRPLGLTKFIRDVTEQQALLTELRRSQQQLRQLYEQTPAMLHSIDAQGRLLSVSDHWLDKLGYSRDDVIGRPSTDFLSAESRQRATQEVLPTFFSAGRCERVPYEMIAKDGSPVQVELSAILERDPEGRPARSMAILEDVTLRHQAERALADEHQRLGNVISATQAGTWEWHVPSGETRFDERWAHMLGWRLSELEPLSVQTWRELVHPDDLPVAEQALHAHWRGETRDYAVELRMRHREGHWAWVMARGGVTRWLAPGQPEWMFGIHLDLSNSKAQEHALRRSQEFLSRAGAVAGVGAWEYHTETQQLTWSDHTRRLFQVPDSYVPTLHSAAEFCVPEHRERLQDAVNTVLTTGKAYDLEFPICRTSGEQLWLRAVCDAERHQEKVLRLIGAFQDISARKQAEQAIEHARMRAEAASRAKGDFLATMSHEIRTPLNAVQGYAYLMSQTTLSPEQENLLTKLRQASNATLECIHDVLDLSKIEANELELVPEPTQLTAVLRAAYSICEAKARQDAVQLRLDTPSTAPMVWADAKRLRQVVLNLLSNAVKFTGLGVVTLSMRCENEGDDRMVARISVSDTGIGMSEDTLSRLFEPFYQANAATSLRFGGTGLGLSIVKRLVTLMQGDIEVKSRLHEGTRFTVTLPLKLAEPAAHFGRPMLPSQARVLSGVHVLVADDSDMNREVASGILMLHGAQVTQAEDGAQAVELAAASAHVSGDVSADAGADARADAGGGVDLVLMDLHMPHLDGFEAALAMQKALGERCPPIVALTGAATLTDRAQALKAGMCGFITKPIDAARLPLEILRALRGPLGQTPFESNTPTALRSPPPGWPRLAGLDTADAAERLVGDKALFARLLNQLFSEWRSSELADTALPAEGPRAQAIAQVHRLRGIAGNAGAESAHRLFGQL
ncbi:MAG: PAS domain S-box protein [Rubrivivax sp.]